MRFGRTLCQIGPGSRYERTLDVHRLFLDEWKLRPSGDLRDLRDGGRSARSRKQHRRTAKPRNVTRVTPSLLRACRYYYTLLRERKILTHYLLRGRYLPRRELAVGLFGGTLMQSSASKHITYAAPRDILFVYLAINSVTQIFHSKNSTEDGVSVRRKPRWSKFDSGSVGLLVDLPIHDYE
ncbi:hypothetical protein QAD02_010422 [Eretmocerus hayati]|uniref:Uncharacterized protein n=1 Tax=Eretmocerus hayati TaxID=131215 RepID=A0ACC2NVK4_9HYME|nr:hypothetical protein QAD02_010422 [Eretmocerus hayati]